MPVLMTGRNPIKTYNVETRTETKVFFPSAYNASESSVLSVTDESNFIGKGSDNGTCATIGLKTGSSAETYAYISFDLSGIPSDARIKTITCKAKASISSTTSYYVSSKTMQLFAGSTAKGSAVTLTTTAEATAIECGTWSGAEIASLRLRLYAKRGSMSTSTSRNMKFYGAELIVTYTYDYQEEVWI